MDFTNLNLNLDNYSQSELLHLFSISHDDEIEDIKKILLDRKNALISQVEYQKGLSQNQKNKLFAFIDSASSQVSSQLSYLENNKEKIGTWAQKNNPITEVGSHIIIKDANREVGKNASISDGRIAGTDSAPPGWLNPINIKTLKTGINIDSRFRDNYYGTSSSEFTIELPVQQHKVINIRVATIDIPMSYYIIDRARGDATLLVVNKNKEDGYDPSNLNFLNLSNPAKPQKLTFDEAVKIGTSAFEIDPVNQSQEYETAWLVIIPDGNYELGFQKKNDGADITNAMNNALSIAIRGIFFRKTGRFFGEESSEFSVENEKGNFTVPNIKNGLCPTKDLCFTVDRRNGKSIFAIPGSCGSEPEPEPQTDSILADCGYEIIFNVDQGGSLSFSSNIQLFLGWQLGFRVGTYTCYRSLACFSEAPCMITGPRYMYISIDDGLKSSGSNFIAAFSQSTLANDIITRINLANAMTQIGVYKTASDIGLSNQLNRTREYFGPVTLKKLSFKLLDEFGRILSFNEVDWSLSIVFEKLYD